MLANTLGFTIATALMFWIGALFPARGFFYSGVVFSTTLGLVQAIALRQKIRKLRIWQWTLANIMGSHIGIFLAMLIAFLLSTFGLPLLVFIPFSEFLIPNVLGPALFGAMVGIFVGMGEALVLSRYVRGVRRWWIANIIGRSLGWLSALLLLTLLGGTVTAGLSQSLVHLVINMFCSAVGGVIYGGITATALPHLIPRLQAKIIR